MLITPEQRRAARALLRLDQATLAQDAGISLGTLQLLEEPHGLSKVSLSVVAPVREALERAGAEFIDRGVKRSAQSVEERQALHDDIDRIVAWAAEGLAKYPPLKDDELYDENGL